MKNATKKGKAKELLDTENMTDVVATSVFILKKFEMKEDMVWRMKLQLKTQLPQSFREYKVKLSLNEEPYNVRIADLERKRGEVEGENQLFEKKTQLKNIDQEIKEVEKELEEALSNAPEIEFAGTIEELKYKDGDTIIVIMFPALTITELNANRHVLKDYKIELIRE